MVCVVRTVMSAPGELRGKSLEELLEILERQEKLLSNTNFIAKLPDRGKRILTYAEKVKLAIAEQKEFTRTTQLLNAFRLEFQASKNGNASTAREENHEDTVVACAEPGKMAKLSPATNSVCGRTDNQGEEPNVTVKTPQSHKGTYSNNVPVSSRGGASITTTSADDKSCLDPELLVKDLNKISLKEGKVEPSGSTTGPSAIHVRNPFSVVPVTPTKSNYIEVLEKRAANPIQKKEKFRTNHLPTSSNSSSLSQSPGERLRNVSAEERRAQEKKHLDDITAARLPPLHYLPTQLLPLDESLALQLAQKQSYEEQQAKLAAQKLMEKLNIKMVAFNPEGDSYLKYRDKEEPEAED